MSYSQDRAWSDLKIPTIKQIVGPLLLEPAEFKVDALQATDLMIMHARDKRIAARVRRSGYADRYPYEFTIRSARSSGATTELTKLIEGFGDWMFYGHSSNDAGPDIGRWYVIDLNIFRANLVWHNKRNHIKYQKQKNTDNATEFVGFDIRSFIGEIVVASSHEIPFFPATEAAA
jgi:hypothetical protein